MGFVPFCPGIAARLPTIRINWATFCLLEVEAAKTTCKEFIPTDLVLAVNLGKMYLYVTQIQATTVYIGGKWHTKY